MADPNKPVVTPPARNLKGALSRLDAIEQRLDELEMCATPALGDLADALEAAADVDSDEQLTDAQKRHERMNPRQAAARRRRHAKRVAQAEKVRARVRRAHEMRDVIAPAQEDTTDAPA